MRRALALSVALFAFAAVAVGLYFYQRQPVSVPPPSTADAGASPEADFAVTLLEEPRPLPDVSFVDGNGQAMTLADFRGKVVLLNVWATWCGPCREEMPTLDRLQAELGGPDFQVVPLSIDLAGLDVVREFYDEVGLKHLGMYVDSSGKASRDLGAVGLPTTLLLDREGRELGRLVGPAEWDSPEVVAFIRAHLAPDAASRARAETTRRAKAPPPDTQPLAAASVEAERISAPSVMKSLMFNRNASGESS